MQFTPLKDFFSPELQSQYCVGLSYTVKADAAHAKLAVLVQKWIAQGLVRVGAPTTADIAKHLPDEKELQVIGPGDVGTVESAGLVKGAGSVK